MKKLIIPFLLLSIMLAGCTSKPGGVAPSPIAQACTEEAKLCPDGSAVGRTGPNCEFAPCSTETWSIETWSTTGILYPQACTMEAKLCPDGSSVGRSWPNCEFAPCPGEIQTGCVPTCACPAWYRQEGQWCNPECYYSTPKCLMPSRQCEPTNNCVQNK